jgi:hypothetical protein
MTLFGTTLDAAQIAGLVGLLAALGLWLIVLGRERGYARWFRQWEGARKARKDAETSPLREDTPSDASKKGPWG